MSEREMRVSQRELHRLHVVRLTLEGREVDCAPPAGEFSPEVEGSAISSLGWLHRDLVLLWG